MFQTNGTPEPELADTEATARPLNASIWLDETGGCLAVSTRSAVGSITAKTRELLRGGRDPRVDTLRGLFLVVMMIDHLPFHPLRRFSSQSLGFVSSAEGFVFVSGLVPRIECLRFKLIVVDEVGYLDIDVFPVSFSTRIPSPCLTVVRTSVPRIGSAYLICLFFVLFMATRVSRMMR